MNAIGELMREPGATGRFGEFGGRFVPESLVPACEELDGAFPPPGATRRSAAGSTACCATTAAARRRLPNAGA